MPTGSSSGTYTAVAPSPPTIRDSGGAVVEIVGAPVGPRDDCAVVPVVLTERFQLAGSLSWDLPREAVALADPEVADRPDVEAPEPEYEEHLGRPRSDATNGREA